MNYSALRLQSVLALPQPQTLRHALQITQQLIVVLTIQTTLGANAWLIHKVMTHVVLCLGQMLLLLLDWRALAD